MLQRVFPQKLRVTKGQDILDIIKLLIYQKKFRYQNPWEMFGMGKGKGQRFDYSYRSFPEYIETVLYFQYAESRYKNYQTSKQLGGIKKT